MVISCTLLKNSEDQSKQFANKSQVDPMIFGTEILLVKEDSRISFSFSYLDIILA